MSKSQTLRTLVNERLVAAAEEIFVLFERTIVEYEEELCRSREENQRKQQLLDTVLYPRIELTRGNFQIPSTSPDPSRNQETLESPQIKEELQQLPFPESQAVCLKTEESLLHQQTQTKHKKAAQREDISLEHVPESSVVFAKTEKSSLLHQKQTEVRDEPQEENISRDRHFHSETEGHSDNDDWGPLLSYSAAQMEPEADGDPYSQVQIRDTSTSLFPQNHFAPETTTYNKVMIEAESKKHQCPFCHKRLATKQSLQIHIRVHTGEKPYSCSICKKHFTQKQNLNKHKRVHTGEKVYDCFVSNTTFGRKSTLDVQMNVHAIDKTFSCSICKKAFLQKSSLEVHTRKHTGEKPFNCTLCNKQFADPSAHRRHMRMHTGERPYMCPLCGRAFTRKDHLKIHFHSKHSQKELN